LKQTTKPELKNQSDRFIEAAKAAGADESGKTFEKAFKKIVKPKGRRHTTGSTP
jgi:hypothetical protein